MDASVNLKKDGPGWPPSANWTESDPKTIWNTYIQLTEVEDSFRTEKHDLGMRPIFHRKEERTQAHILWYMFHPRDAMMPAVQITTSVFKYFLRFADPEFVTFLIFICGFLK